MEKIMDELKNSGFEKINYDLEASFDEALKDESFKRLIKDMKVAKKFLIKYTSLLETSAKEYDNCSKCKGIFECKNKVEGHCYLPRMENNHPIFEYKICKYNQTYQKEHKHQKNIYFSHIPEDIKNANIDDIYMNDKKRVEVIEYIQRYIKDYQKNKEMKGLYLNGSFGCGKTYLVSALFNELAKKGYKSAIVFWPEFLQELKSSFASDFKEKFDYVKKVPLLLIDDIGAESVTEWARDDIFCPIMQYRMENHLQTFFTSNLSLEELEEHFSVTKNKVDIVKSKRIIERIKQLTESKTLLSKNLRK